MSQSNCIRRVSIAIGVLLIAGVLAASVAHVVLTQAASDLMVLSHTVSPAIQGAQKTGSVNANQSMTLTIALQPRNQAMLEKFARDVSTPRSGMYHQYVTPAIFGQTFGPDPSLVSQVQSFAQQSGLRVTQVRSGGLFITLSGNAKQIQDAFHVSLATYKDAHGQAFFANTNDAQLPRSIAAGVRGIVGLDNANVRHNYATKPRALEKPLVNSKDDAPGNASCPQTVGTFGLTPPQLATAYNFPSNLNGAGQRVALVEFDGYTNSDIAAYAACFAPSVNVNNVLNTRLVDLASPLNPGDGAVEDELDIEVLLGLAPGLSKIDVYEAPNTNEGLIDMSIAIANDDMDGTVSVSWGACEADAGFGIASIEELAYLQMAAQGQGVYVATGDTGAYDCLAGSSGVPYYHSMQTSVDDPSADPYVAAVGGTTLSQNASTSAYIGETVWNSSGTTPTAQDAGTGGGFSTFWSVPTWQSGARATQTPGGIANPTGSRAIPDITADADPSTGYAEYCSAGSICQSVGGGWFDIGGTSASAPLWAALAALANQQAGTRIGLITPALYSLYGADTAATHTAAGITLGSTTFFDYAAQVNGATAPGSSSIAFHDITDGSNTFQGYAAGFTSQKGFDAASGLGSMYGSTIVNYLTNNIRFTTPRLYMAAKGTNGGYWLSTYMLNNGNGNILPSSPVSSAWVSLGNQQFQDAPSLVNNGVTTTSLSGSTGLVWLSGIDPSGTVQVGSWNPIKQTFGGWVAVPGTTCRGSTATGFAQGTLFISCMTTSGAIVINAYNATNNTWGGWGVIGGGLNASPTMATDGNKLMIIAQTPNGKNAIDWYTLYTVGTGATTQWRQIPTTCMTTPTVAFSASDSYIINCIAGDTRTMWYNTYSSADNTLSGWVNLGAPAGGFVNATAVTVDHLDSPNVWFFTGETSQARAYVQIVTNNMFYGLASGIWQSVSLAGIFSSNSATDYFGI
jgi:Pro-kumamolisin, activation domain